MDGPEAGEKAKERYVGIGEKQVDHDGDSNQRQAKQAYVQVGGDHGRRDEQENVDHIGQPARDQIIKKRGVFIRQRLLIYPDIYPIWMEKMWDKEDQAENKPSYCKTEQRQFAPTGWRLQKIDAERHPDRPNKPGEEDKPHGGPPDHGWVGVVHSHPDMTFHELLKPSQSGHLRNGKVAFVDLERLPACKRAATGVTAARKEGVILCGHRALADTRYQPQPIRTPRH